LRLSGKDVVCARSDPLLQLSALRFPDKTVVIIAGVSVVSFLGVVVCLIVTGRRRRLKRNAAEAARYGRCSFYGTVLFGRSVSALALLVGQQEGHPACKNSMLVC